MEIKATLIKNYRLDSLPDWTKNLPRICFALQQENRMHECITKCYNGLVLLEVNNLTGQDEASAVRRGAAEMPQTLMTFVGADGQSVKIVCRGEQFTGGLPSDEGGTALFHENLYERARIIYNGQLGVTIEKLDPTTHRICYMSYDPLLFYNPLATAIYAKAEKPTEVIAHQSSSLEQTEGRLGMDRYKSMHTVFEYNLSKAFDETEEISDKDERHHAALSLLAQYCMETGLSMAPAMRQAMMKSVFWDEKELVAKVFENAYREDLVEKYMSKKEKEALVAADFDAAYDALNTKYSLAYDQFKKFEYNKATETSAFAAQKALIDAITSTSNDKLYAEIYNRKNNELWKADYAENSAIAKAIDETLATAQTKELAYQQSTLNETYTAAC